MKTPKKKQLYDVCMIKQDLPAEITLSSQADQSNVKYTIRHLGTHHYNIPIAMAKFYVKTLSRNHKEKTIFFLYVKNGLDPLQVLRERREKAEKKRQDKMFVIANQELESSYKEHNTPYID